MLKRIIIFPIVHAIGFIALFYLICVTSVYDVINNMDDILKLFVGLAILAVSLIPPFAVDKAIQKSGADYAMCVIWMILTFFLVLWTGSCIIDPTFNTELSEKAMYIMCGVWYAVFVVTYVWWIAIPPKVVKIGGTNG